MLKNRGLQRIRLGLLHNALVWRAGSSAAFFVVAMLAVAAAAAGPVYLAAADQSVLQHVLGAQPPEATGLIVNEQPGVPRSMSSLRADLSRLPRSPTGRPFFGNPIYTEVAPAGLAPASGGPAVAVADLLFRTGACAHLSFASGGCPSGSDEVALSTRSAAYLGLSLGERIYLGTKSSDRLYVVAGLYRAGSSSAPFWWGANYFLFGTSSSPLPRIDDVLAPAAVMAALPPYQAAVEAQVPVATTSLVSTQVPSLRRALSALELSLGGHGLIADSGIDAYLDQVTSQQKAMTTTITVIDLQLLLLVLMVLFGIAGRIANEREQDLALASLRGLSRRSLWAVALREPFVLTLAALPLGAAIGWLIALATARANLLAGVAVPFDSLALSAAVLAALAAVAATAAGSRRTLNRSAGQAVSRSRVASALNLAGEAFVIALALAAVVQLSASGVGSGARSQPLAAAAPGLIALAAGVIAARLVPLVCRAAAAAIRFSPKVGLSLALQRVARQSGIIRQAVIVAIAVSLACFSVAGYFVDRTNRSLQSQFLVGASRVLTVSVPANVDFQQAVDRADPSGDLAMAVEVESSSTGTLLAVDGSRFAKVAAWVRQPGAAPAAAVDRYLDPPVAPAVVVQGANLELTADLRSTLAPKPSLVVGLYNEQYGAASSITFGPLSPGTRSYIASLQGDCVSACRLQSITASWAGSSGAPFTATVPVQIERIAEGGSSFAPVPAGLDEAGLWRVSQGAPGQPSRLSASGGGLTVAFRAVTGQASPEISPADVPEPLPAVVTDTVASLNSSGATGSTVYSALDLDGSPITIDGAMRVAAIPSVGTNAVMIDLTDALRDETLPDTASTKQVWLSAAAGSGAAIIRRLQHEGMSVLSDSSAATMQAAFDKDGPTLAFELFLVVGVESALLATGSILFAIAATTRRRAVEAVALGSVGLRRRTLTGAMAGELGIVAATGLVAGTVAGLLAARFSLPSVPEFTGLSPGPTLLFALPLAWMALVVAGAAVLLCVAVVVSILIVNAASTPDKLRISQR